jgi:IS605 OrfB family transposase
LKTSIPACLCDVTKEHEEIIKREMNNYSSMNRFAYKRLQEGMDKGIIEKLCASKTGMNIRFAKDAVEDARQLVQSCKELTKLHLDLWLSRFEKTKSKYDTLINIPEINLHSKKILGLQNAIKKQEAKVAHYKKHIDDQTFDEVIFGGSGNFEKRTKGLITKEQWWEHRNGRISSRGDATKNGNPNLRLVEESSNFFLELSTCEKLHRGKRIFYKKVRIPLYVAAKCSKKTGNLNGRKYPDLLKSFLKTGKAYEVEILKRKGKYRVQINITEEAAPLITSPKNGYKGFDTNPDGLAVCHVNEYGSPIAFSWLGDGGLQDYPTNKRENLIYELAHKLVKGCVKDGTGLIGEDLKFIQDKQVNSKFRRMSHSFCYNKLLTIIERLCFRYGVEFIKVKPVFTSIVGGLKYQQRHRISVHQAAALVIARRGQGFTEKVPEKLVKLITKKQKTAFLEKNEWARWSDIRNRITNLLKKRKAKYYQWFLFREEIFTHLKIN